MNRKDRRPRARPPPPRSADRCNGRMPTPLRKLAGAGGALFGTSSVEHSQPPAALAPSGPPGPSALAREALSGLQLARLLLASPRLARAPRGDGGPVVDIPGWRAPEASMAPLRRYLRWLGHDARTWGLGTNRGDPEGDATLMAERVAALAERSGQAVALVGWSLGGVIAREVARRSPAHVSQVVTYGTPVIGGPIHTVAARSYGAAEGARIERLIEETNAATPIAVPITAIFTRHDGVVAWQACIDHWSPAVRHVEVASTHIGLGIDPDVWGVVAAALGGERG